MPESEKPTDDDKTPSALERYAWADIKLDDSEVTEFAFLPTWRPTDGTSKPPPEGDEDEARDT